MRKAGPDGPVEKHSVSLPEKQSRWLAKMAAETHGGKSQVLRQLIDEEMAAEVSPSRSPAVAPGSQGSASGATFAIAHATGKNPRRVKINRKGA